MRILQICSARDIGGGERHVIDLTNALARRGHDVFAAVTPSSLIKAKLTGLNAGNIIEIPMRNSLNVSTAMKLSRFARDNQIEIVHAHIARDYPLAALIASRTQARLVLTRHVLFSLNSLHRLTLRRVNAVIAVSNAVAESIHQVFPNQDVSVIHSGIEVKDFVRRPQMRTPGRVRVGTTGHLAPIKGHEEFIRAAAKICEQRGDVEFVIAGEDKSAKCENRHALETLIAALGVQDRVLLLGWLEDIGEFLSTLDIFVSAARSEPFGLAIIEAMAAKAPVIATESEGAKEIIRPNITGLIVPIGDVQAMSGAIAELIEDRPLRESLAAAAHIAVCERFSLERMVAANEDVYLRAVR